MWRKPALRRGVITTPAKWVRSDSSCEAETTSFCVFCEAQLVLELVDLDAVERLEREQRVDEEAVAARRGHAPGGGVRARDEAHLLEVGHHVADARGREIEPGVLRQRARAHRLAFDDVALDQRLQQDLRALAQSRVVGGHGSFYSKSACVHQ